jgi:hypothetical protein
MENGGTKMYCPECGHDVICGSVGRSNAKTTWYGEYRVTYFQRTRICTKWKHKFATVEIVKSQFNEFMEIKSNLSKIKQVFSECIENRKVSADSLAYLSKLFIELENSSE